MSCWIDQISGVKEERRDKQHSVCAVGDHNSDSHCDTHQIPSTFFPSCARAACDPRM